ncbi:filamentous hemagglutinin N-terminal domain-containing protein [Scytonema sp. NUACC26]|uniref:two-partner secretion domain-containing protein n=1 Tax=Scytonema sp. NUACC26 TaxID=3140176 RepID=UPI0034DC0732
MLKSAIALQYALTGWFVNLLAGNCVLAQINPDETLGTERSSLVPNVEIKQGVSSDRIEGGATRGSNLFHSFREFNINEGQRVYFNNPTGITNIISRVTGTNPSNLLGTLGVNGSANLFFINPNGIIFGQNAKLDVGGSFVASTANAIQFGNQELFSIDNPNIPGLLTINPSALLFNQIGATASIQNNSTAPAGLDLAGLKATGLRVPNGRSLLLVGGNITMDRGGLNAFDGRVELGGLTSSGTVGLQVKNNSLSLSFVDGVTRADTTLTHGAGIYVDGATGGHIAINARNLSILEESILFAGIGRGLGALNTQAGDITLNATEAIRLEQSSVIGNLVSRDATGNGGDIIISSAFLSITNSVLDSSTSGRGNAGRILLQTSDSISIAGNDAAIVSGVGSGGIGKGGNIDIRAASFSIKDAAQLQSAIFVNQDTGRVGQGDAGDININVTGSLTITGLNERPSGIYSLVSTGGRGNGGNITISGRSVDLLDGANIFANTNGLGNAGTIQINATDFVNISGASATRGDSSEISTRTRSSGKGGEIVINTPNFNVSNGAIVNAETRSNGNGGNITVNARRVEAIDGGQLFSTTRGRGNAGKIAVTATDRVTINGIDTTLSDRIDKYAQSDQTRGILNLANGASGFYVLSLGSGRAGDLELTSSKIQLDNSGRLTAESASGDGGNITLKGGDILLLRRGSFISATAGITGATGGDGGNINIKTNFIVTVPSENSDITANAFEGSGGQVNITAQGIFGIQPRTRQELQTLLRTEKPEDIDPRKLSSNDITAISQKNPSLSGQVITNTPDTDPTQALVQLPVELVDVTGLINQNLCVAANQGSEFTITGRGGLPPSPYEALNPDASWEDWRIVQQQALSDKTGSTRNNQPDRDVQSTNIIEAQGWVMSANGTVILTAEPAVVTPEGTWLSPLDCQQFRANL